MKRTICILISLGLFTSAFSQILKGKFFIDGSMGLEINPSSYDANGANNNNSNGNSKMESYYFAPEIGYYFTDKIAFGLSAIYSYSYKTQTNGSSYNNSSNITSSSSVKIESYTISPLMRYSIPINDKFYFNVNISLPYKNSKNIYNSPYYNGPLQTSSKSFGIQVSPSFQYFLKNNIALLANIGSLEYISTKEETSPQATGMTTSWKSTDLKLSFFTTFGLGAIFYFGGVTK
jgi:hypothetical protein